jgi:hypothetical protein
MFVLVVGGTLAYGIMMARSSTCSKGESACSTCASYVERSVSKDATCPPNMDNQLALLSSVRNSSTRWAATYAKTRTSFRLT